METALAEGDSTEGRTFRVRRMSYKLKKENALMLVEPSEEISKAYAIKSDKCIRVAKLAYEAGIYENAISEAYYSIYNTLTSLFYKCGIKCENHSASAILLKDLFNLLDLYDTFFEFKKDRIDNQYYLPIKDKEPITQEKCKERINVAQRFNIELRAIISRINLKEIDFYRNKFDDL